MRVMKINNKWIDSTKKYIVVHGFGAVPDAFKDILKYSHRDGCIEYELYLPLLGAYNKKIADYMFSDEFKEEAKFVKFKGVCYAKARFRGHGGRGLNVTPINAVMYSSMRWVGDVMFCKNLENNKWFNLLSKYDVI